MQIEVTIETKYGSERIYPACEKARLFAQMVQQKTLTRREIEIIKQLGYAVNVQANQPTEL